MASKVLAMMKRAATMKRARSRPAPTPPAGAKIGRTPSLAIPMKNMPRAPRAPIPFGMPKRRSPRPRIPAKPFRGR